MRFFKLVFVLLSIATGACECETSLNKVCAVSPTECWVLSSIENVEKNLWMDPEFYPPNASRGECTTGHLACNDDKEIYCEGIVYPSEEICDGFDNDCDGGEDEGFDQDHDGWTVCAGDCNDANERVNPAQPELCNQIDDNCDGVIPEEETADADGDGSVRCDDCNDANPNMAPTLYEICDRLDNDCDGAVDEDVAESWNSCGPLTDFGEALTTGICARGTAHCVEGELYCPAIYPQTEACDGYDNNCDGTTDEGLARQCQTECGVGIEYCSTGNWVGCTAPQPTTEICDGFDNDCNGEVDEDCLCAQGTVDLCSNTVDENGASLNCGLGYKECDADGQWGLCYWFTNTVERCDNFDNDCDGVIDHISDLCGGAGDRAGIGECKLGNTECVNGAWEECTGNVEPTEEFCDEKDNDCDGEIDESLNSHDKVDMVFAIDGSGSMCAYYLALGAGIGQYVSDFENTEHRFGLVVFPLSYTPAGPNIPYIMITNLVGVQEFLSVLGSLGCGYPGMEPSYDTVFDIADIANPIAINWGSDAYPYIIMMTDEPAQTWSNLSESTIAAQVSDCRVGKCEPGDRFEVYIFTDPFLFTQWDNVVDYDYSRLIPISPPSATEYAEKLRRVFTNVCF